MIGKKHFLSHESIKAKTEVDHSGLCLIEVHQNCVLQQDWMIQHATKQIKKEVDQAWLVMHE